MILPGLNTAQRVKIQRSRVTRGFVEMSAWDQELRVCPPPDLVELASAMHHRRLASSSLTPVQGRVQTYGRRSVARLVNIIAKYRELCAKSPEAEVVVIDPKDQSKYNTDWVVERLGR